MLIKIIYLFIVFLPIQVLFALEPLPKTRVAEQPPKYLSKRPAAVGNLTTNSDILETLSTTNPNPHGMQETPSVFLAAADTLSREFLLHGRRPSLYVPQLLSRQKPEPLRFAPPLKKYLKQLEKRNLVDTLHDFYIMERGFFLYSDIGTPRAVLFTTEYNGPAKPALYQWVDYHFSGSDYECLHRFKTMLSGYRFYQDDLFAQMVIPPAPTSNPAQKDKFIDQIKKLYQHLHTKKVNSIDLSFMRNIRAILIKQLIKTTGTVPLEHMNPRLYCFRKEVKLAWVNNNRPKLYDSMANIDQIQNARLDALVALYAEKFPLPTHDPA
jgi:hypothetical protein